MCVITRRDWATFERGRVSNAPARRLPEQRAVDLGAKLAKLGALREGGRVSSISGPSGEPESASGPSLGTTASRSTDAARGAAVVATMVRVIGHPLEGGGRFPEGAEDRHAVGGIGPARSGTRATCTLVATNTNVSEVRYGRRAT